MKNWQNNCVNPWVLKSYKNPRKIPAIWLEYLNSIVNRMDNIKSSMFDRNPKCTIKLDILEIDKFKKHAKEDLLSKYRF